MKYKIEVINTDCISTYFKFKDYNPFRVMDNGCIGNKSFFILIDGPYEVNYTIVHNLFSQVEQSELDIAKLIANDFIDNAIYGQVDFEKEYILTV
jgi:hypothetical protein